MTDQIKIDHNIPVPPRGGRYPFAEMQVGDSFFVAGKKPGTLLSASFAFRKKNDVLDRKFSARSENYGARIWRIK